MYKNYSEEELIQIIRDAVDSGEAGLIKINVNKRKVVKCSVKRLGEKNE